MIIRSTSKILKLLQSVELLYIYFAKFSCTNFNELRTARAQQELISARDWGLVSSQWLAARARPQWSRWRRVRCADTTRGTVAPCCTPSHVPPRPGPWSSRSPCCSPSLPSHWCLSPNVSKRGHYQMRQVPSLLKNWFFSHAEFSRASLEPSGMPSLYLPKQALSNV